MKTTQSLKPLMLGLGILSTLAIQGCSEDELTLQQSPPSTETQENPFAISVEDALASLEDFLQDEAPSSRSGKPARKVASVFAIPYAQAAGRSEADDSVNCKNLLYVANFSNKQGFAVLSADKRIPTSIVAVADSGHFSAPQNLTITLNSGSDKIYPGYPLTGDGFFTSDAYPGEVFLNPNTASLYVPEENDTLVGNYEEEIVNSSRAEIASDTLNNDAQKQFIENLCVNYAMASIINRGFDDNSTISPLPFMRQDNQDDQYIGEGSYTLPTTTETETGNWTTVQEKQPLLTSFKYWSQNSPFNDQYPTRLSWLLGGNSKKAPAGCFPLAIAKLATIFHNGLSFPVSLDWSALVSTPFTPEQKEAAATLLKTISSGCHSLYFYQGTFTFPKSGVKFMKSIGFSDAKAYKYSYSRVTKYIDKDCPLIIYAMPGLNITKSHCWNIDGYRTKERTVTTRYYVGTNLKKTEVRKETSEMVHCDFGWKGQYNGYYVSGVFKLNDAQAEYDETPTLDSKDNYNTHVRLVLYTNPLTGQ